MKRVRNDPAMWLALAALLAFGCAEPDAAGSSERTTEAAGEGRSFDFPVRPPGRWRKAPGEPGGVDPAKVSAADRARVEQLESIGYLAGSQSAGDTSGVVRHDRERADAGLNFMTSGHGTEAILMDMEGEVLHRWSAGFDELYPGREVRPTHPGRSFWRRAALYPNGDLLVIFEGIGLAKLDSASQPIWTSELSAHHDLQIMPDGTIYVLTREISIRPEHHEGKAFLEDFVVVLDTQGQVLQKVSLFDALLASPYADFYKGKKTLIGDVFHTNTLVVLEPGPGVRPPGFEPGRVLVALPMLAVTALVDMAEARVVWAHQGLYRFHHDPSLLENGRLLIFDNKGSAGRSRVLELDPTTGEIGWEWNGRPERPLHTDTCGTAQRLPSGNTLITESDAGRALEITPNGETVWEFLSPYRAGTDGELVATLFEVLRLPPDFQAPWARLSSPDPGS